MKRVLGTLIMIVMLTAMLSPLAMAKPNIEEKHETPVFLDVYTSPRYPMGTGWSTGLAGDIITVYANVTNVLNDEIWVTWFYCNDHWCCPDTYDVMTHVSGTLYKFVLPGDSYFGWEVFGESNTTGQDIGIRLEADPTDGVGSSVAYPGLGLWRYIYPASPPIQINATSALAKTTMFVSDTFWVNGTANYWDSTSYPGDYTQLFPADECPVTVKVGSIDCPTKTDIDGKYSVLATAPSTPGIYTVNVTVSNATANRNVPCVSTDKTITVNGYPFVDKVSIGITDHSVYPGVQVTVSGNANYDTGTAVQTNMAYVNFTGTSHTLSTSAAGDYSQLITAPMTPANYTITSTVVDQLYLGTKKSNTTYLNVETPTMDVTINPNSTTPYPNTKIWVDGTATYGNGLPVVSGQVNVSITGTSIYNKSVATDVSGNYHVQVTVPIITGVYTIKTSVDGANYGGVNGYVEDSIVVSAVPLSDLRATNTGLKFNETNGLYLEGHTIKITLNVTNTGNAPASDVLVNFTRWTGQKSYLGSNNITLLNPGTYKIVQFNWTAVQGNHTINGTVDPDNTINEAFETNNKATKNLFIDGDPDLDNIGNLIDEDDDNDGYNDTMENIEGSDPLDNSSIPADSDLDFIPNSMDDDDDNDGYNDTMENIEGSDPLDNSSIPADMDGDFISDSMDDDIDGDGFNNTADAFPDDPTEWSDLDGDKIGDNSDLDRDGDGTPNDEDLYPDDPSESYDTDKDGIADNADNDDDSDGFPDVWEIFMGSDPLDPLDRPLDTDSDGKPDGDAGNTELWMDLEDDGDGFSDIADLFPRDKTEWTDFDGDGIGDNADADDDADGLNDATDDPSPHDSDNDGLINSMDSDDDGDGVMDVSDAMPLDSDNDGLRNDVDADDDGDGIVDSEDAFPLNKNESEDTNGDGIGNNADPDDDGDGVLDDDDLDPLDPTVGEPESSNDDNGIGTSIAIIAVVSVVAILMTYVFMVRTKK